MPNGIRLSELNDEIVDELLKYPKQLKENLWLTYKKLGD